MSELPDGIWVWVKIPAPGFPAGFSPSFPFPGFHSGYLLLNHAHIDVHMRRWSTPTKVPAQGASPELGESGGKFGASHFGPQKVHLFVVPVGVGATFW